MMISKEQEEYIKKQTKSKRKIIITRLLILILFFLFWQIAGDTLLIDPFLTSTPSRMMKCLIKIYNEGTLFKHIFITCIETIIGFLLGTILGAFFAIILWWWEFLNKVLEPYLIVLNALPKIALAPIIIFWVGNGMSAIIIISLLISIVVTIITVLNGFMGVDENKIKLILTLGGKKIQILKYLIIPSSLSTLISALKINVGLSWVGVIMGEFLVARDGLGFLIIYGGQIADLDLVMMSIIILSLIAFLMYQGVSYIEKKFPND